jgi:predicted metal-dependent hydrolase
MIVLGGQHQVQYGTSSIAYELTFSERKTLAIHVYPDCSVVVDAPVGSAVSEIEKRVLKRASWILRQQRQFQDCANPQPLPRRYVSGESYLYLGRQYRLKVVESKVERVQLSRGYLTVSVGNTAEKLHIAQLLENWYRNRARRVFEEQYPVLDIRAMKTRWGSCTITGRILLNPKLIQVPKNLIDYVILHELCHLKECNHNATFYGLLNRVLPNWRELKHTLNTIQIH